MKVLSGMFSVMWCLKGETTQKLYTVAGTHRIALASTVAYLIISNYFCQLMYSARMFHTHVHIHVSPNTH